MVGGLTSTAAKAVGGSRFGLVNLMPATFLVSFVALLMVSGLYDLRAEPDWSALKDMGGSPGWAIIAVFGIFVFAILLRPFQAALVQVMEGYWVGRRVLSPLAGIAIERHRRIRHTAEVLLDADLDLCSPASTALGDVVEAQRRARTAEVLAVWAGETLARYPQPRWSRAADGRIFDYDDRLMPTRLGNVLRDGEDNAGQRYGLDFEVIAPRLYPSLSPKLDTAIRQSLDLIDTVAALCVFSVVATIASLPLVARWDGWSVVPLGMAAVSVLAYRGSVRLARGHARLLAAAVDLHRFDMLSALHYQLPSKPRQEVEFNQRLSGFLDDRQPLAVLKYMNKVRYKHPEPGSSGQATSERPEPESGGAAGG